jgi:hypothetical protein
VDVGIQFPGFGNRLAVERIVDIAVKIEAFSSLPQFVAFDDGVSHGVFSTYVP